MRTANSTLTFTSLLSTLPLLVGCPVSDPATDTTTETSEGEPSTGDGDGDPSTTGDGDGDATTMGDGDGDATTGDGDGDGDATSGDGDGDTSGDGDGDPVPPIDPCESLEGNGEPLVAEFDFENVPAGGTLSAPASSLSPPLSSAVFEWSDEDGIVGGFDGQGVRNWGDHLYVGRGLGSGPDGTYYYMALDADIAWRITSFSIFTHNNDNLLNEVEVVAFQDGVETTIGSFELCGCEQTLDVVIDETVFDAGPAELRIKVLGEMGTAYFAVDDIRFEYCRAEDAEPVTNGVFLLGSGVLPNFGSLEAADAICQEDAENWGLSGTYMAWLSDSQTSAADRLPHSTHPYVLTDGTQIAANWDDLTDGTLAAPINVYANGTSAGVGTSVATGTWADGMAAPSSTCEDWTSSAMGVTINYGSNAQMNSNWSLNPQNFSPCSTNKSLYCIDVSADLP